ncbi:hypothetical protein [Paraburkholderia solisilvae]|uniref:hypothetical protein n=1 Tax=Paraburkholderia solisilvae TaxID=624376 RepID=UPI001583E525|nr:hypothetical protein [Paraburkholderia solisilvae]
MSREEPAAFVEGTLAGSAAGPGDRTKGGYLLACASRALRSRLDRLPGFHLAQPSTGQMVAAHPSGDHR